MIQTTKAEIKITVFSDTPSLTKPYFRVMGVYLSASGSPQVRELFL